jgi:hypothetical protein
MQETVPLNEDFLHINASLDSVVYNTPPQIYTDLHRLSSTPHSYIHGTKVKIYLIILATREKVYSIATTLF